MFGRDRAASSTAPPRVSPSAASPTTSMSGWAVEDHRMPARIHRLSSASSRGMNNSCRPRSSRTCPHSIPAGDRARVDTPSTREPARGHSRRCHSIACDGRPARPSVEPPSHFEVRFAASIFSGCPRAAPRPLADRVGQCPPARSVSGHQRGATGPIRRPSTTSTFSPEVCTLVPPSAGQDLRDPLRSVL